MYALRISLFAGASPILYKSVQGFYNFTNQSQQYKQSTKKSMSIHTSEDSHYSDVKKQTSHFNQYFLKNGINSILDSYQPAWFYFNSLFGLLFGQSINSVHKNFNNFERVYLEDKQEGKMCIDVAKRANDPKHENKEGKEKCVILLHGVTGNSTDEYIKELSGHCTNNGFNVIAVGHYAPANETNLRLMDFNKQKYLDEVILYAQQRFKGKNQKGCEVYLIGFSLGGNHILRYQGEASKKNLQNVDKIQEQNPSESVRALISISNPFDVLSTTIKLKTTTLGIFDYYLARKLYFAYKENRFKNQHLFVNMDDIKKCKKSILELDNITRAKAFGFNSANELYREISCGHYLSYIDKPFLIIYARDDIIVKDEDIPKVDLLANQNCLYLESDYGGHCDFFAEKDTHLLNGKQQKIYKRLYSDIVIKYLEDIGEFDSIKK